MSNEAEQERAALAKALHAEAVRYWGQGFKTDPQYWERLATAALDHLERQDNG